MKDERREMRAATDTALRALKEALEMGVVPRAIEVDGNKCRIEVASYQAPQAKAETEATRDRHIGHLARLSERMARTKRGDA